MSKFYEGYSHAIVRGFPNESFLDALTLHPPPEPISIEGALKEHENYEEVLKELGLSLISVPKDERCPDCVFVEDTLVVIPDKGLAIVTRPGAPSRQPEVGPVKEALLAAGYETARVRQLEEPACLDGGDVMYTGRSLWVGLSARTNMAAVEQLRALLGEVCPVVALDVAGVAKGEVLHLKSLMSLIDQDTVLLADHPVAHAVMEQAKGLAPEFLAPGEGRALQVLLVPDMLCSNVLRIGSSVVVQAGYPASEAVIRSYCESKGLSLKLLSMKEHAKADGALTCCSVLLTLPAPTS